jgi:myo-inositol-1-phosphate synthase
MNQQTISSVRPVEGRLGVLTPGIGAVATTFFAGVYAIQKGLGLPVGSLTQMAALPLDPNQPEKDVRLKDALPLASVEELVFGGWDVFSDNAYEVAKKAGVLEDRLLDKVRPELEALVPMPAVFDAKYVARLNGTHVKSAPTKMHLAEALRADIRAFMKRNELSRAVMVWCASTEAYLPPGPAHQSLDAFEAALKSNDPTIAPSMIYAYAAIKEHVPFVNGAPNLTVDIPAIQELAAIEGVPLAGKDFKTGQTLVKTVIAPMLKSRMLGLSGWFSTNILGNRDGEVLDDPANFKSKEVSKLSVLDTILEPDAYPALYGDYHHKVTINYYPPRGDNKEGWDNIDLTGWLGYPMQLKVNFLCRDSILAAPLVLDLALLADLAHRSGLSGLQEWMSFYFKSPMTFPGRLPEHDLFAQERMLVERLSVFAKAAKSNLREVKAAHG